MVKYFFSETEIKSAWDQVFTAFWQRYPNPFSKHVLTEDVIYRELTTDNTLVTRRLLIKTNRLPRWAERFFPSNLARCVYIMEDSVVDPRSRTLTTFTCNINHATLMVVKEQCVYSQDQERPTCTHLTREAWISSGVFGFSRAIQEFGLARFKSNQVKAMKGLEYALSNLHGEGSSWTPKDKTKDATVKAKETALAATEKAKTLATAGAPQKPNQFV